MHVLYESRLIWIFFFLALYWAWCIYWGVDGARKGQRASDYFICGRSLPPWPFIMAVTATSFSGWLVIAQPSLIMRDGFPAGYLAFCAIVVPLTGVLFFKRLWMLSRRFGFVTQGELLAVRYDSDIVRVFSVIVAILFAVPFLGVLLGLAGHLVAMVSGGVVTRTGAMWLLSVFLVIYVTLGGLRAVAQVATVQTLLAAAGITVLGLAALHLVGGFEGLSSGISRLAATPTATWGTTLGYGGGNFNSQFALSGVAQWTAGLGVETPTGGPWTSLMVLSSLVLFLGLQASPAFTMWAYASATPVSFGHQQVWASALITGVIFFVFCTFQGLGGMLMGGNPAVRDAGLSLGTVIPAMSGEGTGNLTGVLITLSGQGAPWIAGLLTVCMVAAITAATGAYMTAAGASVTRDLYMRYFNPSASDALQKRFARVFVFIATVLALAMSMFAQDISHLLGFLALGFALQLLPSLIGALWVPWLTRQGVAAGIIVGSVVVVLTDPLGQYLTRGTLPWGQWPWTIHAGTWGLVANLLVCVLGSAVTRQVDNDAGRARFHDFLSQHDRMRRRWLVTIAWGVVLIWFFFAIGPGAILGNYLFGDPAAGHENWDFAIPSIWVWQLLWWGAGVLLIWFLAFKLELATSHIGKVVPLADDSANQTGVYRSRPAVHGG